MDTPKAQLPKKTYQSPMLTVYGPIRLLTQSRTSGTGRGDNNNPAYNPALT